MTTAESGTTMATDGVNFINEDDARRILLALLKKVANAAGADADKHFDEVGTGNREEGNIGFASDSASKQSLASTWRSDEENALRNTAAELLEFLRVFEELDNFLKLLFGFVGSSDVLKGDFFLLRGE